MASGGSAAFTGVPGDPARQGYVVVAGERLWARIDGVLRHPLGARVLPVMLSIGEPGTGAIIRHLQDDPRWQPAEGRLRPSALAPARRFVGAVARGLVAYDASELPALFGRKTGDLDPEYRREVVHRDEMVLVGPRPPKPVPTA